MTQKNHTIHNPIGIGDPVCASQGHDWCEVEAQELEFRACSRCERVERMEMLEKHEVWIVNKTEEGSFPVVIEGDEGDLDL